jgi:Family of unknown function (DUF6216)
MRRRIWRVVYGKIEIKNPQVQEFIEDETDLAAFNFQSGRTSMANMSQ